MGEVLEMEMATCVECGREFLRFAGFESNGKCANCTYLETAEEPRDE